MSQYVKLNQLVEPTRQVSASAMEVSKCFDGSQEKKMQHISEL